MTKLLQLALALGLFATPTLALDRGPPAQTFGPLTVPSASVAGQVSAGSLKSPTVSAQGANIGSGDATVGHVKMLPTASPTFLNAHNPANTPQPDGVFITPSGPYIDYCSIGGCLDGNHLRSHMLINTTTKTGADAQENALAINFTSKTGKVVPYAPNTAFTVGQSVRVFGSTCQFQVGGSTLTDADCLYTPAVGGTTGSSPPNGNTTASQDGSVTWKFLGGGPNDGKTALNIACVAEDGAGTTWCTNFNFSIRYKGAGTAWGEEKDCNNGNETSSAGSRFLMACTFYGGGGSGTYPMLAYQYVGSGAVNAGGPNPYGAGSFVFISGQPSDPGSVIKDDVILDAGNSDTTIHALEGRRHAKAFLLDESNSNAVLRATGTHANAGIDFISATFPSGNAITLPGSTFINWGNGSFAGRNGSLGAWTVGNNINGMQYSLGVFDNGDVGYANHLFSRGVAPALSACGGGSLVSGATDDYGVVSLASGSTGCNVTFASTRANKPSCTLYMTSGQVPSSSISGTGVAAVFSSTSAGTELHYQCRGR